MYEYIVLGNWPKIKLLLLQAHLRRRGLALRLLQMQICNNSYIWKDWLSFAPSLFLTGQMLFCSILPHNPFIKTYLHVIHWCNYLHFAESALPNTLTQTQLHTFASHIWALHAPCLKKDSLHVVNILHITAQWPAQNICYKNRQTFFIENCCCVTASNHETKIKITKVFHLL